MKIIKNYRRSISISVDESGDVIVKAPLFLSSKKIDEFVKSKEKWIEKQQDKVKKREELTSKFDFTKYVYIDGKEINFDSIKSKDKRTTKTSFYTKKFYQLITPRAEKIATINGFKAEFKLCNSRSIWGSCSTKKIIKLNWKLVLLPINLQEYVIYHELSHLKEMNHSKKFWNEVEKLDKDYKKNRNELKEYSFLLGTQILI